MRNAEQILKAYAEAEPWKKDHDAAMRCFEMDEVIELGNLAFRFLSYVDAAWQERVAAGKIPYTEEDDRQIGKLYETWVNITEQDLVEIEKLTREGFEVRGATSLIVQFEEARSLLESRALEAEMRPIEEILPLARGNPRPERYGN